MLTTEKRAQITTIPVCYKREDYLEWLHKRFGKDFGFLADHLPLLLFRKDIDKLRKTVGLPLGKSSMENLDSLGQGPKRFM